MKQVKTVPMIFCTICLILVFVGCGKAEKKELSESMNLQTEMKADSLKEWVEVGGVALEGIQKGDTVTLKKTDGSGEFMLHVRRVSESVPGIISISAKSEGSEMANASLILRNQRLAGFFDLYEDEIRYKVGFDSVAQRHYIQKMKAGDADELEGGTPLTPDKSEG